MLAIVTQDEETVGKSSHLCRVKGDELRDVAEAKQERRGWEEIGEGIGNGMSLLRLWLRWHLQREMQECQVNLVLYAEKRGDELRDVVEVICGDTGSLQWQNRCENDGETINAIRDMRQREEMQKQCGNLELNTGDEGKHFSGLFKLSTCRFYTKMTGSNPKAQSRAKRRSKTKNKGSEIKEKRKECPKTCKSDWKNATNVYNHEQWTLEHLATM